MGASLLVLKNKSDVAGCMNEDDIRQVDSSLAPLLPFALTFDRGSNLTAYKRTSGTSCSAQRSRV